MEVERTVVVGRFYFFLSSHCLFFGSYLIISTDLIARLFVIFPFIKRHSFVFYCNKICDQSRLWGAQFIVCNAPSRTTTSKYTNSCPILRNGQLAFFSASFWLTHARDSISMNSMYSTV